jgi:hypothetical protein
MIKSNAQSALNRYFFAWFIALFAFAFFEWRHTGFVSYVFPFPFLMIAPGLVLIVERLYSYYRKKYYANL